MHLIGGFIRCTRLGAMKWKTLATGSKHPAMNNKDVELKKLCSIWHSVSSDRSTLLQPVAANMVC